MDAVVFVTCLNEANNTMWMAQEAMRRLRGDLLRLRLPRKTCKARALELAKEHEPLAGRVDVLGGTRGPHDISRMLTQEKATVVV